MPHNVWVDPDLDWDLMEKWVEIHDVPALLRSGNEFVLSAAFEQQMAHMSETIDFAAGQLSLFDLVPYLPSRGPIGTYLGGEENVRGFSVTVGSDQQDQEWAGLRDESRQLTNSSIFSRRETALVEDAYHRIKSYPYHSLFQDPQTGRIWFRLTDFIILITTSPLFWMTFGEMLKDGD